MRNQEVAALLYEIADLMEIKGEMVFKVVAYRRAAQNIEGMTRDIEEIPKDKLTDLPGIGKGIAETIAEYLENGKSKHLAELKKGLPEGLTDLLELEGVGPKKVKLFLENKIKNIKDLEKAAKEGRLQKIEGLGEKTEKNILESIENSKKRSGRVLLGQAMPMAEEIISYLKKSGCIEKINVAGSIRRRKETIGDIDILVTSRKPEKVLDFFTKIRGARVIAKGPTKASISLVNGAQVDLRVLPPREYGSALLYFTGSKEHNVELRKIAIAKKMKLSEYGLFSGNKFVAGITEEDVYRKLGLDYIEPEMREARGEIEAAQHHRLPDLVELKNIRGDLQMHTKWSDGVNTIEEMASAAKRLGYEYICITDHVGNMKVANALNSGRLEKQHVEINTLQKKLDIRILHGAEIDIRADGSLDIEDSLLKELDIVLASLHSALKSGNNTQRILAAMENPQVDIIAHPSGRLIDRRDVSQLDMGKIIDKSKETNTILEINSQPNRLDINDVQAKMTIEHGCKIAINTDAHSSEQLGFMQLGVATARRGWVKKNDVINTFSAEKMLKMLKN
jgi:DNA polymerase (family 10)